MTEANKEGQTKKPRKMLFSDLSLFLNKDITLILNNDEEVSGTLTFFDEGANCQITHKNILFLANLLRMYLNSTNK